MRLPCHQNLSRKPSFVFKGETETTIPRESGVDVAKLENSDLTRAEDQAIQGVEMAENKIEEEFDAVNKVMMEDSYDDQNDSPKWKVDAKKESVMSEILRPHITRFFEEEITPLALSDLINTEPKNVGQNVFISCYNDNGGDPRIDPFNSDQTLGFGEAFQRYLVKQGAKIDVDGDLGEEELDAFRQINTRKSVERIFDDHLSLDKWGAESKKVIINFSKDLRILGSQEAKYSDYRNENEYNLRMIEWYNDMCGENGVEFLDADNSERISSFIMGIQEFLNSVGLKLEPTEAFNLDGNLDEQEFAFLIRMADIIDERLKEV